MSITDAGVEWSATEGVPRQLAADVQKQRVAQPEKAGPPLAQREPYQRAWSGLSRFHLHKLFRDHGRKTLPGSVANGDERGARGEIGTRD